MNRSRRKGFDWERQIVKIFKQHFPNAVIRRNAMSGAIGTIYNEPDMAADVVVKLDFYPHKLQIEAKAGYGGSTMSVKKQWMDTIKKVSDSNYSFPVLALKFSGARSGAKHLICTDIDSFIRLLKYIQELENVSD